MTKLSVNINKIATLRNARGGNVPDVIKVARDIERFGAEGITVHPRPDERHIRYADARQLAGIVTTGAITSNAGWNTIVNKDFLINVIKRFKAEGIRTSIFVDANPDMIEAAAETGTDRVELYTESYATEFFENKEMAIAPFIAAAERAQQVGLGLNAGHDLSLQNLKYFSQNIPGLLEVSIGHALICDALYFGLENTVNMYKRELAR